MLRNQRRRFDLDEGGKVCALVVTLELSGFIKLCLYKNLAGR